MGRGSGMSRGTKHWSLLAGASMLAITVALGAAEAAAATWASGDYANPIGASVSDTISITGNVGTLTNSGTISSNSEVILNNGHSIASIVNSGTFSSFSLAIRNSGSIGTLTNSGTIDAFNQGFYNNGTIGSLSNDGTITSGAFDVIENQGSIGVLRNGGLIETSSNYAIDNTGIGKVIGTLHNSGTIASTHSAVFSLSTIYAVRNEGVIRGGAFGVANVGTISSLSNSGSISGDSSGISNSGYMSTLTNNGGTVSGTGVNGKGIVNSGIVSTLNNSGTISATGSHGVHNYGANIGALSNSGTIQGQKYGISNEVRGGTVSSISTLTNQANGIISGAMGGVYNDRNIGGLINRGVISGTGANAYGITNSGSLNWLANSGTITGAGTLAALHNASAGTLGVVTNSGLIAGTILNESTRTLTIAGGDSISQMGILTGASGSLGSADRGTIVNTSSNVVFNSGYLLLNDNISVGTVGNHTVSNTGATLQLNNAITITGDFVQNGGALISKADNGTIGYGALQVFGDASVSGTKVTISGADLTIGQRFVVVDASGSGSGSGNSAYVAVTNGLGAAVSWNNNQLIVTLTPDSSNTYTGKGQVTGGVAAPVGVALDKLKDANPNGPFKPIFDAIDALPSASQGDAIKQLAPTQNAPSSQMGTAAANAVLGAVEQHQQTAMAYDSTTGMAAGSETRDTAIWGQFLGGGARRGSNSEADGYRLWDFGLATGIDHRFTPHLMGGAALSWVRAWASGSDNSAGSFSTLDSYQLTLYGTYRLDRAFIDGQLGLGWNEFDQKRAIGFLGSTASAQYSGQQYLAKATVGYDVPVAGMTVTPLASLRWMRSVTQAYDEEGAGAANLSVDRQGVNSVSQDLGAKVSWDVPTSFGLLKPEARLAWVHDYTSGPIATSAALGGQAITTSVPRTEADGVKIGLAASLSGDDAMSLRAEYEGELRAQYQSHTGLVKAIWGF